MSWVDAVQIVKGPIASRPAANAVPPNKYGWFATDTLVLSISDGSVWTDIGPGGGGVPTSRTLTAGAALTGGGTLAADRTFDVAVDGSTIEVSSDALRVKADGITANEIAAGAVGASELAATAVTPATYGDATHVGQFTVDADGRITAASDIAISGGGGSGIPAPSSSPPGSPADGDLWVFPADNTNGIYWMFMYDSSQTTYKWRFLGGPPMSTEVPTDETTTSATYAALATAGPSLTVARAGDYIVNIGASQWTTTAGASTLMSYDIGGTGAVDADATIHTSGGASAESSVKRDKVKSGIAAGTALVSKYRRTAGTAHFEKRWISVLPVRVI